MVDFAAARRMMVDGQVRTSDVTDLRLVAAMLDVPRERFVPPDQAELAYLDLDIQVLRAGQGQPARYVLKPMVLAKLLQAAEIGATDRVLDVGCTTGYSSAVLGKLAHEVAALEQEPRLVHLAAVNLAAAGAVNVSVVAGPLTEGWRAGAPYDVICFNGATEMVPATVTDQLKEGGRLVGVLRRDGIGSGMLYRAVNGSVTGRPIFDAAAPLLPGFAAAAAFVF
jgi:protein-L-isoaspartate(D-aspartate) O-methyltransferase